jgi:hypothetical protein
VNCTICLAADEALAKLIEAKTTRIDVADIMGGGRNPNCAAVFSSYIQKLKSPGWRH